MGDGAGHVPVLPDEVLRLLGPAIEHRSATIMDCTLGLGGHALALLRNSGKDARLIGMDADKDNVIFSQRNLAPFRGRVHFFHAYFSDADEVLDELELDCVDAIIADLGFSSNQMENPRYGLSFREELDGPLDMRFNRDLRRTAAGIVNNAEQKELADLIYRYGEERFSRRIAREIVRARTKGRIERSSELAKIIARAVSRDSGRRGKIHPATRTFQALRIAVNDELGCLEKLLNQIPQMLSDSGRAAIISFQSLEDRLVKHAFADLVETGKARLITRKPIVAGEEEIASNPRSRSAKLRCIEYHAEN